MPRAHPAVLFALALAGCAAGNALDAPGSGYAPYGGDSGVVTGTPTGTTSPANVPELFALAGALEVVGEQVDVYASAVTLDYRNGAGDTVCSGVRPILSATAEVNDDPDLPLYGWWTLSFDASPCGEEEPAALNVGIGAWDAQLDGPAAAQNLDGSALYALYARRGATDPVWVFGATGTAEQFNGYAGPVTGPPLPDGRYELRTLYLLPLQAR